MQISAGFRKIYGAKSLFLLQFLYSPYLCLRFFLVLDQLYMWPGNINKIPFTTSSINLALSSETDTFHCKVSKLDMNLLVAICRKFHFTWNTKIGARFCCFRKKDSNGSWRQLSINFNLTAKKNYLRSLTNDHNVRCKFPRRFSDVLNNMDCFRFLQFMWIFA